MKKSVFFLAIVSWGITSITAQKPSECQRPDAHMNPNCSGAGPSATPAPAFSLGGSYALTGTTPDGKKYQGSVDITGDAQGGYQFHWTVGNDKYDGTGTVAGDTITVDWGAPEPAVYKVLEGGALLKGKWGKKGRGRETLKRGN